MLNVDESAIDNFEFPKDCRPKWKGNEWVWESKLNSCGIEVEQSDLAWIQYTAKIGVRPAGQKLANGVEIYTEPGRAVRFVCKYASQVYLDSDNVKIQNRDGL